MPKASEMKTGMIVEVNDQPYIVRKVQAHSPSARGAATLYKTRFNHARTGQKFEEAFKGDDFLQEVDFSRQKVQFLFVADSQYTFMNLENYDQYLLDADVLEEQIPFLLDGLECLTALLIDGECVAVELPQVVEMEILETAPAMKSASASSRTKPATFKTGLEIQIPEYLAQGEVIKINTETKSYMSRA